MTATLSANPQLESAGMTHSGPAGVPPQAAHRTSPWADTLFSLIAHAAAWLTLALLAGIIVSLLVGAAPAIREYGLSFLWRSDWDPVQNKYGGLVMIYGTLMTSFIALLIAVPVSFGIALFLTELSPNWLKRPLGIAVELLAAVARRWASASCRRASSWRSW
jgi:phosphate transport system permease protein